MKNPTSNRWLAFVNLLILIVILADVYILKPQKKLEVLDHFDYVHNYSRLSYGIDNTSVIIVAKSGKRYLMPPVFHFERNENDTFFVRASFLFKAPLELSYETDGDVVIVRPSLFDQGYFVYIACLYVLCISVINLSPVLFIRKYNTYQRLLFIATSVLGVVIILYLWN